MTAKQRCGWVGSLALEIAYHDEEWGGPSFDDDHLFEMLTLEGAQAGLSWITILKKRANYRASFADFDPGKVARFRKTKRERLLQSPGIVRNRLKIESTIRNAKAFLKVQQEFGSFSAFAWGLIGQRPIQNRWQSLRDIPAQTAVSRSLSNELKQRGFSFVGPTICYAFMQAVGMVNDHETGCSRHRELSSSD